MTPTIASFEERGWFLSQEGIDLIASENPEANTLDDFISCAKDMDLRLLTAKGFNKTTEKVLEIPSPLVLQVLEVHNVAMPSVNQVEKPRLLSVVFTDGSKKKYKAVEVLGKVDCLKLHTPPGTKFLVTKPIEIKDQILVLGPGMLKELGGHVQELVQAWRAGKQFLKRFGGKSTLKDGQEGTEQGPPVFVPFKVKPIQVSSSVASDKPRKAPRDKKENTTFEKKGKKGKTDKKLIDRPPKAEDKKAVETNHDGQPAVDSQSNSNLTPKQDPKRNAANKREKKVRSERKEGNEKLVEKKPDKKPVELKERSNKKNASKPVDANVSVTTKGQEEPVAQAPEKKIKPSKRRERKEVKGPETVSDTRPEDAATPPSDAQLPTEKKNNRKKKVPKSQPAMDTMEKSSEQQLKQEATEQLQSNKEATEQQVSELQPLEKQNDKSTKPSRKERPSRKKKAAVVTESKEIDNVTEPSTQTPQVTKPQGTDSSAKPEKKANDRSKKKNDKPAATAIVEEQTNDSLEAIDVQPDVNAKKPLPKKAVSKRSAQVSTSDRSRSTTPKSDVSFAAERKPRQKRERKPRQPKRTVDQEKPVESVPTTVSQPINDHQQASKQQEEPTPKQTADKQENVQAAPSATPPTFSSSLNSTPTHITTPEVPVPNVQLDEANRYGTPIRNPTYYNTPSPHQPQTQEYYYHHQDIHHPPVQQQQAMYAPMVDYSMMVPIDPNTGMPAGMYSYPPPPQQQPYMQPMYYMSDQQPTYYANHQPHYTQLYDEAHYEHHYGSYGRGRGGMHNNNNNTRGRGVQSRGEYKQ